MLRWRWIGHVLRIDHASLRMTALQWVTDGTMRRGRPRTWRTLEKESQCWDGVEIVHGDKQGSSHRAEQDGDVASRPYVPTKMKKKGGGDCPPQHAYLYSTDIGIVVSFNTNTGVNVGNTFCCKYPETGQLH